MREDLPVVTKEHWKARINHARRIERACIIIAEKLGITSGKRHGDYHDYSDELVRIRYDDYGNNLDVFIQGKQVLNTQLGNILSFDPYPIQWCKHVVNLARPLFAAEKAEKELKEFEKQKAKLQAWGFFK